MPIPSTKLRVGCCGWGFFRPAQFFGTHWRQKYASTLQAYASKFACVEVNSTFYHIPKIATAAKWLNEARATNPGFEFTVKAFQGITHGGTRLAKGKPFGSKAMEAFKQMRAVCKALDAKLLLFQSPASFAPNRENIEAMKNFFNNVERGDLVLVWEPRGAWWNEQQALRELCKLCKELDLVCCVDPLRNQPQHLGSAKIAYFRLHGFGKPTMYNYKFSDAELKKVKQICGNMFKAKARRVYVMFNNYAMYEDATRFERLLH